METISLQQNTLPQKLASSYQHRNWYNKKIVTVEN